MKLLLLLLLIPFVGMGQSGLSGGGGGTITSYAQPTTDTVKVVMIYSDTTIYQGMLRASNNTLWMKGYEVITRRMFWNDWDFKEHREYLDAEKKPLSKNIIVWQSKPL